VDIGRESGRGRGVRVDIGTMVQGCEKLVGGKSVIVSVCSRSLGQSTIDDHQVIEEMLRF
jgi:hypothetical protein